MAKYGLILLAFALAVIIPTASALKCWRCSSDSQNGAFCTDPFDQTLVSEQNRRWSYIDCSLPTNHLQPFNPTNTRPVCKKIKQLVNDKLVVQRSCFFEDQNAVPNSCLNANTPSYIKTEFCETCNTDGCNGAGQFGPIAILVAIPTIILAKILA